MQTFTCPACQSRVFFHNLSCACGQQLFFDPEAGVMLADAPACAHRDTIACNWAAAPDQALCRSCAMTEVLPDLEVGNNQFLLERAEGAKRWVLANVAHWGWFTDADPGARPKFQMLSENTGGQRAEQIIMGHENGQITINVTESDELIRLQRQQQLGESYRSMTGHFRHEMAHFFFDRLARSPEFQPAFRALFGDEREDYAAALQRHYESPQPPGEEFITAYATAHPHEDWAETVAHLLHMVDFTDSFVNTGLSMPSLPQGYQPYAEEDSERLLTIAADVAIAVNDINRALENPDLYPFVLTEPIRRKLAFAHDWMSHHSARGA